MLSKGNPGAGATRALGFWTCNHTGNDTGASGAMDTGRCGGVT